MRIDKDIRDRLSQIGARADRVGNSHFAEAIFAALSATSPDNPNPALGLGLAKMAAGKLDEAESLLASSALLMEPDNRDAKAYLVLLKHLKKDPAAAADVVSALRGGEAHATQVAESVMEG